MTRAYEYNKLWRHRHPEKRHAGKMKYYRKTQDALNSRKRWTPEEERELVNWTGTDHELAAKLLRSVEAIQHKRHRLQDRPASDYISHPIPPSQIES